MEAHTPSEFWNEIIEFFGAGPSIEAIIALQPSEILKQRSHYLFDRNRNDKLTTQERLELDEFARMNHLVNMIKIRARQKLDGAER